MGGGSSGDVSAAGSTRIEVAFRGEFLGIFQDRIEVVLEDVQLRKEFVIVRSLRASVGDKETFEELKPVAPYQPRRRVDRSPETEVIEGPKPEVLDAITYISKLPQANIPRYMHDVLSRSNDKEVVGQLRGTFLPRVFDSTNHSKHFKCLLWVEEYRSECVVCVFIIHEVQADTWKQTGLGNLRHRGRRTEKTSLHAIQSTWIFHRSPGPLLLVSR